MVSKAWTCVVVCILWSGSWCEGVWLETYRSGNLKVPEDTLHELPISLRFNESDLTSDMASALTHDVTGDLLRDLTSDLIRDLTRYEHSDVLSSVLRVTVVPDEEWKLNWENRSVEFSGEEVLAEVNKSLVFSGYYWGRTKLAFYLTRDDLHPENNGTLLRDDLEITIDRKSYTVDTTFIIVGSLLVLLNNINMGSQLNLAIIKSVLRRPVGPLCGFVSQFAVMPLATYFMGWLLFTDPLERLGLFTLGCCPGGTSSNFWTLMFNGNINLSITMTAISTLAAMGMMPLWLFTLGQQLLENNTIKIPFANLAGSLVAFTIPVTLGIFIRHKRPQWAMKGAKVIKPFSFFILLFFIVAGSYNSYKVMLVMTWQMVVAGIVVILTGYTLGAVLARLVCLPKDMIIAVSIETALQNPGVAFVLLKLSVESPYSDLASLPIIAALTVSGPPLILVFLVYTCLRRWFGCCPDPVPIKDLEADREAKEVMLTATDTK